MKGYKLCTKCNTKVGVRTLNCQCGFEFIPKTKKELPRPASVPTSISTTKTLKKKRRKKRKHYLSCSDWRTLESGDVIKVLQGSGPYQIINDQIYYLGYSGLFTVVRQDKEGVLARKTDNSGMYFIYLNEEVKIGVTGSTMSPHKILVKNKEL